MRTTRPRGALPAWLVIGGALLSACAGAPPPAGPSTEATAVRGVPEPAPDPGPSGSPAALLDALRRHAPAPPVEGRRNPFRFDADGGRPAGPMPAAPRSVSPAPPIPVETATAPAPGEARDGAAAGGLRLLGFVEARDRRVAVLRDGDGVYHGQVNEVLKGRYRVASIRAASVEVEDLPRGTRATLRADGALESAGADD